MLFILLSERLPHLSLSILLANFKTYLATMFLISVNISHLLTAAFTAPCLGETLGCWFVYLHLSLLCSRISSNALVVILYLGKRQTEVGWCCRYWKGLIDRWLPFQRHLAGSYLMYQIPKCHHNLVFYL